MSDGRSSGYAHVPPSQPYVNQHHLYQEQAHLTPAAYGQQPHYYPHQPHTPYYYQQQPVGQYVYGTGYAPFSYGAPAAGQAYQPNHPGSQAVSPQASPPLSPTYNPVQVSSPPPAHKQEAASQAPYPLSTDGAGSHRSGSIFHGHYLMEKTLGQGSYGKVKLALDLRTQQRVALKFISKASFKKPSHIVRIRREVRLLRLLRHEHLVRVESLMETPDEIVLVMEHVPGGELLALGRLEESRAKRLFAQLVAVMRYLHAQCVLHRDLKPQNLLLGADGRLKLVDFGFANQFDPGHLMGTFCGSPYYAAPEMIGGVAYAGPEVDIWSMGVILYSMLTGSVPFQEEAIKALYAKIQAGLYAPMSGVSPEAADLVSRMLTVDPAQRASLADILQHPWLASCQHLMSLPELESGSPVGQANDDILREIMKHYDWKYQLAQLTPNAASQPSPSYSLEGLRTEWERGPGSPVYALHNLLRASDLRSLHRDAPSSALSIPGELDDLQKELKFKLSLKVPKIEPQPSPPTSFKVPEHVFSSSELEELVPVSQPSQSLPQHTVKPLTLLKPRPSVPSSKVAPAPPSPLKFQQPLQQKDPDQSCGSKKRKSWASESLQQTPTVSASPKTSQPAWFHFWRRGSNQP